MDNSRRSQCIVAVDVEDRQQAQQLLDRTQAHFDWYKVGLQLFLKEGAPVVEMFKNSGKKVFLDLKLHDIPATVGKAARSVAGLEPDMLTVHASGGREMIAEACAAMAQDCLVLGVTVLTSFDASTAQRLWQAEPEELAQRWLTEVEAGGAGGFVCSPWEVETLKRAWGSGQAVTPGIRFSGGPTQDQKRVATPSLALKNGADYLVIGRAITTAEDMDLAVSMLDNDLASLP